MVAWCRAVLWVSLQLCLDIMFPYILVITGIKQSVNHRIFVCCCCLSCNVLKSVNFVLSEEGSSGDSAPTNKPVPYS